MSVLSERKEAPLALFFETHKSGNRDVSVKRLIVWLGQKNPTGLLSPILSLIFLFLELRKKGVFENVHFETSMV